MNHRIDIIQKTIDHLGARTYLEIGVAGASTFLAINAGHKVGVDPKKPSRPLREALIPGRLDNYQMTSDAFFAEIAPIIFADHPIDVAFVDGLHEWRQAVRDVENVLRFLGDPGVIIMHDCNPTDELVATPWAELERLRSEGTWPGGSWCGDTFKAVVWLRAMRPDLRVFVLDCDWGLGIITRGAPESRLVLSPDRIESLTYADLEAQRELLLNLKDPSYLAPFLRREFPLAARTVTAYCC